jgi:hypothetical protein
MSEGQGHSGEAFRRRIHDDHRLLFPRIARGSVPNSAPDVDHLLAVTIYTARSTEFAASAKIFGECFAYGLVARAHKPADSHLTTSIE